MWSKLRTGSLGLIWIVVGVSVSLIFIYSLVKKSNKSREVQIAEAKRGVIEETVDAPGKIGSAKLQEVKAKQPGLIRCLAVKEGEKVKKGQVLCIIRNPDLISDKRIDKLLLKGDVQNLLSYFYRAFNREAEEVETSRINYVIAKKNYEQCEFLYEEGALSEQQLTSAQIQFKKAEFLYQAAKKRFEDLIQGYRVTAPFNGTIIKSLIYEDMKVASSEPLFTMADMNQLIAEVKVDELEVKKIEEGQPVRFLGDIFAPSVLHGKVKKISKSCLNFYGGDYTAVPVICEIGNAQGLELKIGSLVTARIVISQKQDALLIPASAILLNDEDSYAVYTVNSNRAKLQPIKIGISNENLVEVCEGLKVEDKVITVGNLDVKNGELVSVK